MNNIESELKNIGIKANWFGIFKKSSFQIFKEVSKKWGKFDKEGRDECFKANIKKLEDSK